MSWFSQGIKAVGKGIQKVANQKVAGVSLGGMLGPLGQVVRGGNIKQNFIDDFKAGAKNVPMVLGGVKALPKGGVSGVGGTVSSGVGDGVLPSIKPGTMDMVSQYLQGDYGGEDRPWWQDALGFLGDHAGDIAKVGLGAAAGVEGIKNSKQAAALNKDALAKLNGPLNAPDLNYLFADPQNPFKKGRMPVVGRK
jgi:hypothetical protein